MPTTPVTCSRSTAAEAERAIRGLRSVGVPRHRGLRARRRPGDVRSVDVDELDGLIEDGATVIDVREHDERDDGYIPGSRNIPYRLLRTCGADLPDRPADRHDLRQRPARSDRREHPRRPGLDARPVVDGGVSTGWPRGDATVSFRRCGS